MGVNMEIMAPGKRVYELRRLLKLTQTQLAVDLKNRTTLSNVENGKYNLTLDVAEKIAPILEKARIENNVRMQEITAEFLMQDEKKQADEIMERIIRELILFRKNAESKRKEFEMLCESTQKFIRKNFILIDEKRIMEMYDLILEITYNVLFEYKSCFGYATSAYEVSTKFSNYDYRIKYLSKMIRSSSRMSNLDVALSLCESAFALHKQFEIKESEFLKEIYRHYILVLKKKYGTIGDKTLLDKCFEVYDEAVKNNCLDEYSIAYTRIILANIWEERNDYKKALMIDFEVLEIAEKIRDVDLIGLICGNIAERAILLNNRELAIEYLRKTNESKQKQSESYAAYNSKINITVNIKLDNLQIVKDSYKNAINENMKIRDKSNRMGIIDNVYKYFLGKNSKYMEDFLEFILNKIKDKEIEQDLQKLELMFFKASHHMQTVKIKRMATEIEIFLEK